MNTVTRYLLSCVASTAVAITAVAGVSVGKPAPDFTLPDQDGNAHSLSDYAGRIVVLEWVNHGCPFVAKHYNSGNMPRLQKEFTAEGVVWLSICSSAPGKQGHLSPDGWKKAIATKKMASSAVLIDEDGIVGRMYGARTTPHMYVIDPEGNLAYMGAIDSIPSTKIADIDRAENYVSAAIRAVMKGEPVAKPTTNPYGCGVKYGRDT